MEQIFGKGPVAVAKQTISQPNRVHINDCLVRWCEYSSKRAEVFAQERGARERDAARERERVKFCSSSCVKIQALRSPRALRGFNKFTVALDADQYQDKHDGPDFNEKVPCRH